MRRLLWVGDAAVASGFAKCTHHTLEVLRRSWEVEVVGINYQGEKHTYPYHIYPATMPGGDAYGVTRMAKVLSSFRPELVLVQNDPWNLPAYMRRAGNATIAASMPVDGKNCRGRDLNGLAMAIFWTKFGQHEAELGGYTGPSAVVPLGVDLNIFTPGDKGKAIATMGLPPRLEKAFIVGNINRNQPRKRMDLTISYFAEWVKSFDVQDAYLYLHVAPTGDKGYDVSQLMKYYGLSNRLIIAEPPIGQGAREETVVNTYRVFDAQINTGQGEGWGLTTMEGMACGVPQIVGDWAALGEWVGDAAMKVKCTEISCTPDNVNAIGGIPARNQFIASMDHLYRSQKDRDELRRRGLELVSRPEYRWESIGTEFGNALNQIFEQRELDRTEVAASV